MGGNSRAIDRATGEVKAYANKIDLKKLDILIFRDDVLSALKYINQQFKLMHGHRLWADEQMLLINGVAFNGSSEYIFGLFPCGNIEELLTHKPFLGDIDITVPKEHLAKLFDVLANLEGRTLGEKLLYIGQNRQKVHGSQISAVFEYKGTNIQIDFEGTHYVKDCPTNFAKFAHSSPWIDTRQGLKGVAHKYLLMVITWVMSQQSGIVILTDKSPLYPPKSVRRKILHQPPRVRSFSVDKGLRNRLVLQQRQDGSPYLLPDGFAWKEIPTCDSTYVTDLSSIFTIVFQIRPQGLDVVKMSSFLGLVDLCKEHLSQQKIVQVFDELVRYKLFGPGQELSRTSAQEDREVKVKIIDRMLKEFPYLNDASIPVEALMTEYYASYKEKPVDG